jgi:dimeric dUTPase (all-alpha-NTP-PPase superfamily)
MKTLKTLTLLLFITIAIQVKAADNAGISHLIKAYLGMKDALATDNSKAANAQAKLFTAAIKEAGATTMTEAQKTAWTKYSEKLRFNGDHISESTDIAHQREHFTLLSNDFYGLIKNMKTNDITLYRQYCPMKKAYWLSASDKISNPYYGKEMDECGEVKEKIEAMK